MATLRSWDGFLLPEHERRMGLLMRGDTARARAAMQRLRTTGRLRIVTMGASITAGQGRNDAYSYPEWLALWAREVWAPQLQAEHKLPLTPTVEVVLAAVPGTQSSYMSVCMGLHVPPVSCSSSLLPTAPSFSQVAVLLSAALGAAMHGVRLRGQAPRAQTAQVPHPHTP